VWVECEGFETQRFQVFVPRGGSSGLEASLLQNGTTPEGFVYVPPGEFLYGGDPRASHPAAGQRLDLDGFFIARYELSNAEWFAFVNDPETLTRIHASERTRYLPRDIDGKELFAAREDGSGYDWFGYRLPPGHPSLARAPVLGISREDLRDYLAWRNQRAADNGEPWTFDLPTEAEWEKAARGVDGRSFPWGNRFDPSLCNMRQSQQSRTTPVPVDAFPMDSSVYGVRGMAGNIQDLVSSEYP